MAEMIKKECKIANFRAKKMKVEKKRFISDQTGFASEVSQTKSLLPCGFLSRPCADWHPDTCRRQKSRKKMEKRIIRQPIACVVGICAIPSKRDIRLGLSAGNPSQNRCRLAGFSSGRPHIVNIWENCLISRQGVARHIAIWPTLLSLPES